jgi:trimeric autotransporter adhesin
MISKFARITLAVVMAALAYPALARQTVSTELQRLTAPRAAVRPIAEALDADGRIAVRPDFRGSFDAKGWRLAPSPNGADGAPRFVREDAKTADDESWRDVFSSPGTDDIIRAVAVRGNEVFVGGQFAVIGKASVDNVAWWDGTQWKALGEGAENGVDGAVYSLTVTSTAVYVGGSFRHAGTVAASNIAKWDGASWSALGTPEANGVSGFGQIVYAIAVDGSSVYVGGFFTEAGGAPASGLAVFDTTAGTWSEFGGVRNTDPDDPAYVFAIAVAKKEIVVGGKFARVGATDANNIARWNRKQGTWLALGEGADNWVTALAVKGKTVYAGGFFGHAGGLAANCIARWNGKTWSPLAKGLSTEGYEPGTGVRVKGLGIYQGRLYVTGYFTHAGDAEANSVAEWRGKTWRSMQGGLGGGIRVPFIGDTFGLGAGADGLYVVGAFNKAGASRSLHVSKWTPATETWAPVADAGAHEGAYEGFVYTVAVDRGIVYLGGSEMIVGGKVAYGVAQWDGTTWTTLGEGAENGVDGYVNAIAFTPAGDVVIGGLFGHAGTKTAINVARWDGTAWSDLGIGVGGSPNSQVFSIATDGDDVYVAGLFPIAGEIFADNIARWDGTTWNRLGSGIPAGAVFAVAAREGVVYAGGEFREAGGVQASGVARWQNGAWSALGSGVDGIVFALALQGERVIAGGDFSTAGNTSADDLAVWSGGSWAELAGGVSPAPDDTAYVLSLAVDFNDRMHVGGRFAQVGDSVPAANVAVLGGDSWAELGSGTNDTVAGVAASGGSTFLAGPFSRAGGKPSVRVAEWAGVSGR